MQNGTHMYSASSIIQTSVIYTIAFPDTKLIAIHRIIGFRMYEKVSIFHLPGQWEIVTNVILCGT